MVVLVLNSGGSSLKWRVYDMPAERVLTSGAIDRIGSAEAALTLQSAISGKVALTVNVPDTLAGLRVVLDSLAAVDSGLPGGWHDLDAVAHKLAHGGTDATGSTRIDERVISALENYAGVVPVHNPPVIASIRALRELLPKVPQFGTFETHFHAHLPEAAWRYALPEAWYRNHGVRRYGFHSCSHRYVAGRVAQMLDRPLAELRIIICHLGSGTSVCGVRDGHSVDISSGFTPQSGTPMSTRSGDFDPFILTHLMARDGLSVEELNHTLTQESGLAALSGVGGDLRDIRAAASTGDGRALLALDVFVWNIRRWIGACLPATHGVDAIAFTGGIGENDPQLRAAVCADLEWLGVSLDPIANASTDEGRLSPAEAPVAVFAVRTDEEVVVARDAWCLWAEDRETST